MTWCVVAQSALLVTLACASAAGATPTLAVDRACHAPGAPVAVTGGGFAPLAPFAVTRDGQSVAGGTTDGFGALAAGFRAPRLEGSVLERAVEVRAADATGATSSATFSVARTTATIAPRGGGRPNRVVRFGVFGFGRAGRAVWLHYVDGAGRERRAVRLGTTSGPCGSLKRTRARRLFPFAPRAGAWRLQFDTARAYRSGRVPRAVLNVEVGR